MSEKCSGIKSTAFPLRFSGVKVEISMKIQELQWVERVVMYVMRQIMSLLNTEACTPVLLDTQSKNEHSMSSLKVKMNLQMQNGC